MNENRVRRRWLAWLGPLFVIAAAVTCHGDNNNVVNPLIPTPTAIPGVPTATPRPGNPPPTPMPGNPTPTPAPGAMNATVNVGEGGGNVFMDQVSGNGTTTISVGGTVNWRWVSGVHSTTSGSCPGGGCSPDGNWNSGINSGGTFMHTFTSAGTFPYFCEVHGAMMQGTVVVH
jgi:plastocyanin